MRMMFVSIGLGLCLNLAGMAVPVSGSETMQKHDYVAGQVWTYSTRPIDLKSTLTVLKVDEFPKVGKIIHIRIDDVNLKNSGAPGGVSHQVGHIPIAENALSKSTIKLLKSDAPIKDTDLEGYKIWRSAFDQGKAGAYSISVADAVDTIEVVLNK